MNLVVIAKIVLVASAICLFLAMTFTRK